MHLAQTIVLADEPSGLIKSPPAGLASADTDGGGSSHFLRLLASIGWERIVNVASDQSWIALRISIGDEEPHRVVVASHGVSCPTLPLLESPLPPSSTPLGDDGPHQSRATEVAALARVMTQLDLVGIALDSVIMLATESPIPLNHLETDSAAAVGPGL